MCTPRTAAISPASRPSSVSRIARARSASPRCSDFDRARNVARSAASAVSFDLPGMLGLHSPYPGNITHSIAHSQVGCLADAMKDANPADLAGNNPNIPAGFIYLGQFIDHDITLDFTSIGEKQADPQATENFRTPALDLDSVYGLGPDGSRQLYARNSATESGKTPGP